MDDPDHHRRRRACAHRSTRPRSLSDTFRRRRVRGRTSARHTLGAARLSRRRRRHQPTIPMRISFWASAPCGRAMCAKERSVGRLGIARMGVVGASAHDRLVVCQDRRRHGRAACAVDECPGSADRAIIVSSTPGAIVEHDVEDRQLHANLVREALSGGGTTIGEGCFIGLRKPGCRDHVSIGESFSRRDGRDRRRRSFPDASTAASGVPSPTRSKPIFIADLPSS